MEGNITPWAGKPCQTPLSAQLGTPSTPNVATADGRRGSEFDPGGVAELAALSRN